jgi:hypothetical protein
MREILAAGGPHNAVFVVWESMLPALWVGPLCIFWRVVEPFAAKIDPGAEPLHSLQRLGIANLYPTPASFDITYWLTHAGADISFKFKYVI